jgi:hypothetical protein
VPLPWLHNLGYKGSPQFTYQEAFEFAQTSREAAIFVCEHVLNQSNSTCGDSATSNVNPLLVIAGTVGIAACIVFVEVCATAIAEGALQFVSGGSMGVNPAGLAGDAAAAGDATEDALTGTALARQLGLEGEDAFGVDSSMKVMIPSVNGTARRRFPDFLTDTMIIEIKNRADMYLSTQLQDYMAYANLHSLQVVLVVRWNTVLTAPLKNLEASGQIIVIRSLPPR